MVLLVVFLAGLIFGGLMVGIGGLHLRVRELEKRQPFPYRMRNGFEDLSAIDTDVLLWIRDALTVVEGRMQDKQRLMSEIRQGRYEPEQAAAPRRRGNGRPESRAG